MSVTDEVKARIDIVDLISRYTPLKKAGSTYKGLCPFHSERTPSFVVFPHTGTWRCFGACGSGGDVFSFIMKKENLDFREALQTLAREAGVQLDEGPSDDAYRLRAVLHGVNDAAAGFFQEILRSHPAAQPAREYLQRRGIDEATSQQFRIGFALESWDALRNYLSEKGYGIEQQLAAGVVKRHPERESVYDAFRNRVTIPIRDRQERIIGFGGRVLDGSEPKYLNTADTSLFHKSQVVYGIDLAYEAIRQTQQVVIVEGYMDVIAAHQHGYANVVACMGTSLTTEQLRQLQRFTDNFVLALDADSAGQQATIRGLNQARQALDRVRKPAFRSGGALRIEERLSANLFILSMPETQDPDDVIRQDPAAWPELVAGAQPLVDFYFDVVARQFDLASAQGKGAAVAELAPLIAELEDEIERQHYVQKLSRLVQIDELMIEGRVRAAAKTSQAGSRTGSQAGSRPETPSAPSRFGIHRHRQPPPDESVEGPDSYAQSPVQTTSTGVGQGKLEPEDYLLANLLRETDLLVWLASAAEQYEIKSPGCDDWQHVENQEIFRSFRQFITSDEQWDLELFQDTLTGHLHGRLGNLLSTGERLPPRSAIELRDDSLKVLVRMRVNQLKSETTHIKYLMDEAQRNDDHITSRSFDVTHNRNLRELAHLQKTLVDLSRVLLSPARTDQGVKIG